MKRGSRIGRRGKVRFFKFSVIIVSVVGEGWVLVRVIGGIGGEKGCRWNDGYGSDGLFFFSSRDGVNCFCEK